MERQQNAPFQAFPWSQTRRSLIPSLQEKRLLAATFVAEKNTKLLQNVLLLDFATILYFSQ
jgi:hypothetical protein